MKKLLGVLALVGFFVTSTALAGGTLYSTNSWGGPSSVWTLDQATAAPTKVTDIFGPGDTSFSGAAFLKGTFWVSDMTAAGGWELGWVDLTTGAYTFEYDQASSNWHGLAGNHAAGLLYSVDIDLGDMLVSYSPATGVRTDIGSTGIDGRGMCYDDGGGVLYATGGYGGGTSLYSVSTSTGASTLIGTLPFDSYLVGLAYDETDDVIWAVDGLAGGALYKIDPATAAGTFIGTSVDNMDGLTWIPEPTTLGLLALGGLFVLRRR